MLTSRSLMSDGLSLCARWRGDTLEFVIMCLILPTTAKMWHSIGTGERFDALTRGSEL